MMLMMLTMTMTLTFIGIYLRFIKFQFSVSIYLDKWISYFKFSLKLKLKFSPNDILIHADRLNYLQAIFHVIKLFKNGKQYRDFKLILKSGNNSFHNKFKISHTQPFPSSVQ